MTAGAKESAVHRMVEGEWLPPPPPAKAKIKLSSLEAIRIEMAKVYREARAGKMDTQTAGRLTYMLSVIAKTYSDQVLEERIAALEKEV